MIIGLDGNEANVKNRVGSGRYVYELLKEFAKTKDNQFIIHLKTDPLPDLPEKTANFSYKVFGPSKLWTQFALPVKLTLSTKLNVFASLGHYGPRFSRIPYVITIHDLSYLHFPQMFKKEDLYQLTNWSKYSIENSAHVIAVSQCTKDDIVKNYKVDPKKISVTYEGYDKKNYYPQQRSKIESVKKKYKILEKYIIFVGTLQPRKNIERLLEAFKLLEIENLHFRQKTLQLVICGKKGWLYDSIYQKAKDLNVEKRVIFTDFVPDIELPALISGAKAYVLPSLWEGFGIPVIEAQACGVPVVVSSTSSLPEIVGNSGILIDPISTSSIAEGLKKVFDEDGPRRQLIKKGFENIKRFSWQKCASETLSILSKVASK